MMAVTVPHLLVPWPENLPCRARIWTHQQVSVRLINGLQCTTYRETMKTVILMAFQPWIFRDAEVKEIQMMTNIGQYMRKFAVTSAWCR